MPTSLLPLCLRGKDGFDVNPEVGDGIDAEESKALQQSPFKLAISDSKAQGSITGTVEATELDNVFYAFRGIRYASAARWEDPKALLTDWTQMENAEDGPACPQQSPPKDVMSEKDCLWLNVFTPELSQLENPSLEAKYDVAKGYLHEHKFSKHAVIVFLHPAGLHWDKGWAADEDYGPLHLLDYETLLVTVNYRLGEYGFGRGLNLGLKDQNAALQWVNKNIDRFGGDANRVTVMGHGSGAAAAHLHMLSPMSKGLFKSVISMSGSALNPWAFIPKSEWTESKVGPRPEELISSGRFERECQWMVGVVSEEGKYLAGKAKKDNLASVFSSMNLQSSQAQKSLAEKYMKKEAVYYYQLHQPNASIPDVALSHGDDLHYLFPMTLEDPLQKNKEDQVFRDILLRMISDFVRFGHPTVNTWNRQHLHHSYWRHFKSSKPEYMDLKMNYIKMKEDMFANRLRFWNAGGNVKSEL
ncbi:CG4382 CG4382PAlike [Caligus rogercresseyi]|uniref:CG4382 CG4382PAlike n=1 Tax=Caligus rogercresseyi TaxID=217165 RepID=A0A7T8KK58_CALRO|nr:CG4382 CG4382PAlike [Caligus rogercresseyi]